MRDYQPEKNNPYWIPKTLYRRTLALIRDYDRMKEEREEIPTNSASGGGSGGTGDRTGSTAVRSATIAEDMAAVEHALQRIPEEYRRGIWESVLYGSAYPEGATVRTWSRYKAGFIYHVAMNKGWIK